MVNDKHEISIIGLIQYSKINKIKNMHETDLEIQIKNLVTL